MNLRWLSLVVLLAVAGCGSTVGPSPSVTTPYITPEERAKMPPHERDDPYTMQHMQKPESARRQ
jgi:hypothetical protein